VCVTDCETLNASDGSDDPSTLFYFAIYCENTGVRLKLTEGESEWEIDPDGVRLRCILKIAIGCCELKKTVLSAAGYGDNLFRSERR
jgi:hypothetical protein